MYGFSRQEWVNRVCPILRRVGVTSSRLEFLIEDVHGGQGICLIERRFSREDFMIRESRSGNIVYSEM